MLWNNIAVFVKYLAALCTHKCFETHVTCWLLKYMVSESQKATSNKPAIRLMVEILTKESYAIAMKD